MIYNEGFDIILEKSSYTAFSMYSMKKDSNGKPVLNFNYKNVWNSNCYATLNGWYNIGNRWGCWYATKKDVGDPYKVTNGEAPSIHKEHKNEIKDISRKKIEESVLQEREDKESKEAIKDAVSIILISIEKS